jgi:hypothetical protein
MRRSRVTVVAVAVAMLLPSVAQRAHANGIVFESYTGNRPPEMAAIMRPALAEFEARGFAAQPESVMRVLGDHAAQPGIENPDTSQDKIAKQIAAGMSDFDNFDYASAAQRLSVALLAIHSNPALVVRNTDRQQIAAALIGLAVSLSRQGDHAGAEAAIAEYMRTFPGMDVSRASFGPEAEKLYKAVKLSIDQQGRGALIISVNEPSVAIFVNEGYRGLGSYQNGDLLPGHYRVYLQGKDVGRRYEVDVRANDQSRLDVDWSIDPVLNASHDWVGFLFATTGEHAKEGDYAIQIARKAGQDGYAVVLTSGEVEGTPAIVGHAYNIETGQLARAGMVALTGDQSTGDSMRTLARFLSGDRAGPGVKVIEDRLAEPSAQLHASEPRSSGRTWIKWASAPAAVGAAAASLYLFSIDGKGTCSLDPCAKRYDSKPGAIGTAALAGGLAALTVYLFIRDHREHRSSVLTTIEPLHGGVLAGFAVSF